MEIWRASRTESVNQSQRLHRSIEDAGGVASLTDLCIHSDASAERSIGRSSPHKLGSPLRGSEQAQRKSLQRCRPLEHVCFERPCIESIAPVG